jgi:colanic acid/amylovoran biosynthesis glycosyltransferase
VSSFEDASPRIGYVLKMYPRFSETFILNEILALEEQGADLRIFSLRHPVDGRFHEALAAVRAPVEYVAVPDTIRHLWDVLRDGRASLGEAVTDHLPDLLESSPGDAAQAIALAAAVKAHQVDHLHAHFGSVATTVARIAARLAGVRYSFTAHAKDIFHDEVDPFEMRRKLADASAVVTVSDYNRDFLRTAYGAAADRVVRIYNGIDLDAFAASIPRLREPRVVGVGRLVEKKGFDHLVDAMGVLARQERMVRLDLIGAGPDEGALRQRVAALGLDDRVTFHGPLPQNLTRDLIRGAAVLAAPCVIGRDGNRDGLPTVVLEGLALGTPVVTTPVTGIPEAVIDGETGLLVPEGDPGALAAAVCRLIDDPGLSCGLAAAGRRHAERHFDSRRNTAQLLELMRTISTRANGVAVG